MSQKLSIPCLALLAATATAQSFTSPAGLEQLEGDSAHFALFHPSYARFQQIDDTVRGAGATIQALGVRRDGQLASPSGVPRTLDLTVIAGHGDYASRSGVFASNYRNAPTTVFARRTVNTPDWSVLASVTPAPFDFRVALDNPWSYNGTDALVLELVMENVSELGSPNVDRELGANNAFTQTVGATTFDGCLVAGQGLPMTHTLLMENYGATHPQYAMRFGMTLQRGPVNRPAIVNIDIVDQRLTVPGLCTTLHCMPGMTISLPTTNSFGNIDLTYIDLPYLGRSLEGRRFYTQIAAIDLMQPGLSVALSDARFGVFPFAPRPAPNAAYVYAATTAATAGTLWQNRAIVFRFEQ